MMFPFWTMEIFIIGITMVENPYPTYFQEVVTHVKENACKNFLLAVITHTISAD